MTEWNDLANISDDAVLNATTRLGGRGGEGGGGGGGKSGEIESIDYGLAVVTPLCFFLVVSMVLALGGNVMVILTMVRHRGMRTRTNLLLANLAIADILVAVLDMPIALLTIVKGKWIFGDAFCFFNGFTVGLGLMLSVHTLMWISIHKYISITKPFSRPVTPRKIVLMILGAWMWTIFFNLTPTPLIGLTETVYKRGASQCGPPPPEEGLQYVHAALNTNVNLVIPCCVMIYCYYKIFKEVKDHLSRMQEFADVSFRNSLIQQKQITETLCIVLSVFILFWSPYIGYSMSLIFLGEDNVHPVFNPIAYLCGYMNSACNPIIYALRSPSFRRGFSEIICWKTQYMPVEGRSIRSPNSQQTFGGMMVSFRSSFWRTSKKNEMNKSTRDQPNAGRQMHNHQHSQKALVPAGPGTQKEINSCELAAGEQPSLGGSGGDVKSTLAANICESEQGDYKSDEISGYDTQDESKDDCPKIPSSNEGPSDCILERDNEESVHEKTVGEKSEDELTNKTAVISKSSEGLDSRTELDAAAERQRHASASFSGTNVTSVLRNNLNVHIDGRRISNSHREILDTTAGLMTDQVRSVSAGDIRIPPSPALRRNNIPPPLKPFDPRKKPLLWQASVDNLCGSPLLSRRQIFHIRRVVDTSKSRGDVERVRYSSGNSSGGRKKKWSINSSGSNKLGVSAFISNVKKSFTDLLNLDGEMSDNQDKVDQRDIEETDKENKFSDE